MQDGKPSRLRRRADRIREVVDITQVLSDYGYAVFAEGGDREQQFACDMHGTGQDNKPSARVYPESNSAYCFACDKTRDALDYVMAKEGLSFVESCRFVEVKYHLPSLPWEDSDNPGERPQTPREEIEGIFVRELTLDGEANRVKALLEGLGKDRMLGMDETMAFWEALDMLDWRLRQGQVTPQDGLRGLATIRERILGRLSAKAA